MGITILHKVLCTQILTIHRYSLSIFYINRCTIIYTSVLYASLAMDICSILLPHLCYVCVVRDTDECRSLRHKIDIKSSNDATTKHRILIIIANSSANVYV